ncbi:MAG: hsp70 family protein [Planctomycetaceae bacterium]|jgi:molecular chaperone DnaK (HSP70)|nr:hsp70 family protein [Planctomycetaceae bacterium]
MTSSQTVLKSQSKRYIVGIDLGTTNSATAFIDTADKTWKIETFPIPQISAIGLIESRETLPSFHYEPRSDEWKQIQRRKLFNEKKQPHPSDKTPYVVGMYAREYGGKTIGRLIASAKSWLCYTGIDRTSKLLPWQGADDVAKLSPVDATARYLAHIRAAWDQERPHDLLAEQDVVITLPASFDETARELTIRAARAAGIPKIVLLEEPQAAFYAWMYEHRDDWQTLVTPGQKILVCDVGGGTTDLTLIRVRADENGTVRFHRVAVGEHLILGGDNLDLALAHYFEEKIAKQNPETSTSKLSASHWGLLVRIACDVKEKLLANNAPEKITISVPGVGSRLIGGAKQIEATREEIEQLLTDGFMPFVSLCAKPSRRQSGVREFGLPYAADSAVTRYLANFLTTHQSAGIDVAKNGSALHENDSPIPDFVLLNGGMFEARTMQKRIVEQIHRWSQKEWDAKTVPTCRLLENKRLDLAVARGAAYYGMARRGIGERIGAGLARTYYLGVETKRENHAGSQTIPVCLLPAGTETDHETTLNEQSFELLVDTPIQFPIYVSSVRLTDRIGEFVPFEPEQMTPLPPLQTIIKTRRKNTTTLNVRLAGKLTEIGTLELWCVEIPNKQSGKGNGRWRLDFDVRSVAETDRDAAISIAEREGIVDESTWRSIRETLAAVFETTFTGNRLKSSALMRELENVSGMRRDDFPASLLRRIGDELTGTFFEGRQISAEQEQRWLNLVGYAYRPGFGSSLDDWRTEQIWRKVQGNLTYKTAACRLQNWILWRRIAGGLSSGQQQTLADPLLANVRDLHRQAVKNLGRGADMDLYSQEGAEIWRLLGSLELLPTEIKTELGNIILDLSHKKRAAPVRDAMIWTLGRLGSRELLYGGIDCVVSPQCAEKWLRKILTPPPQRQIKKTTGTAAQNAEVAENAEMASLARSTKILSSLRNDEVSSAQDLSPLELLAVMQIARKTGDRYRDVNDATRNLALERMERNTASLQLRRLLTLVREISPLANDERNEVFGETLPTGLKIRM